MSAFQELNGLYQEWRRLSEAEGEAIRRGEWPAVEQCQEAKYKLQSCITMATEVYQSDLAHPGGDPLDYDRQFRGIVADLIQLEERNGKWLEDQKRQAREQLEELARTSSNLRLVRRAYASGRSAAWSSYS
jgi:hypothetical protein